MEGRATLATDRLRLATAATPISAMSTRPPRAGADDSSACCLPGAMVLLLGAVDRVWLGRGDRPLSAITSGAVDVGVGHGRYLVGLARQEQHPSSSPPPASPRVDEAKTVR